jgi:hypothetical protein
MIRYTSLPMKAWRPLIGQAPASEYLPRLTELRKQISALIDSIPKGSVDQAKVDALTKTLDNCSALGVTKEAVQCLDTVRGELEVLAAQKDSTPKWPMIVGGVVVVGLVGWMLFGD